MATQRVCSWDHPVRFCSTFGGLSRQMHGYGAKNQASIHIKYMDGYGYRYDDRNSWAFNF